MCCVSDRAEAGHALQFPTAFFCAAQRFLCASAILLRPAAETLCFLRPAVAAVFPGATWARHRWRSAMAMPIFSA